MIRCALLHIMEAQRQMELTSSLSSNEAGLVNAPVLPGYTDVVKRELNFHFHVDLYTIPSLSDCLQKRREIGSRISQHNTHMIEYNQKTTYNKDHLNMNKKTQPTDAVRTQMLALTDKDFKAATVKWATNTILETKDKIESLSKYMRRIKRKPQNGKKFIIMDIF